MAILTDCRGAVAPSPSFVLLASLSLETAFDVAILGLDAARLLRVTGLPILEGVRRADFGIEEVAEGIRDMSAVFDGVLVFGTGNWGRADGGGGNDCVGDAIVAMVMDVICSKE